MSAYYKYDFISPEGIFATVQEDLKAYFDTGSVDNLMFPTYLNKCLEKLGSGTYSINEEVLFLEDFQARLPDNFRSAREVWMCTEIPLRSYQGASSFYSQTASTTIQVAPFTIDGTDCVQDCHSDACLDLPEIVQAVYKTNQEVARSFQRQFLLLPGNISATHHCDLPYMGNPQGHSFNSFDIRDNKIITTFREGTIYLLFYAMDYDSTGSQKIPDNYRIKEYIEAFLKFKVFETLTHQVTDETFNQLQQKMVYYKQASDEAYIMATLEMQKNTVYQKQRAIKKQLGSFSRFELPTRTTHYRRNS